MAFDLLGPSSSVALHEEHEVIVSTLPEELGIAAPLLDHLWDRFYEGPRILPEQVARLASELSCLRAAYVADRKAALAEARGVRARDPGVADGILERLLRGDPVLDKIDELLALCAEAQRARAGIRCLSD